MSSLLPSPCLDTPFELAAAPDPPAEESWEFGDEFTALCRARRRRRRTFGLTWLAASLAILGAALGAGAYFAPSAARALGLAAERRWRDLQTAAVEFGDGLPRDRGPIYFIVPKLRPLQELAVALPAPSELRAERRAKPPPPEPRAAPTKLAKTPTPGAAPVKKAPVETSRPAPQSAPAVAAKSRESKPDPKPAPAVASAPKAPPKARSPAAGPEAVPGARGATAAAEKPKPKATPAAEQAHSDLAAAKNQVASAGRVGWRSASTHSGAGGGLAAPRLIENPPPEYPPEALAARQSGRVLLRVAVRADGSVDRASVYRTSGAAILDQAAMEVIHRWRFEASAIVGDVCEVLVPITFAIEEP